MSNNIVSFEEFSKKVTNLHGSGDFSFGFNWLDFVQNRLTEDIINLHVNDLKLLYDKLGIDLKNKSLFDIGCGSGLSSLSFQRLGCSKITSLDIDSYSVEAATFTKNKFSNNKDQWSIYHGSILNEQLVENNSIDIVYSWGVLHHTGDMWAALRKAVLAVKPGGLFHVALYRSGPNYTQHLEEKFKFKFADRDNKLMTLYKRKKGYKGIFDINSRGMNKFHDSLDWLGGLPYEVCDPEVLASWLKEKYQFKQLYFEDWCEGGNFTMVLEKQV